MIVRRSSASSPGPTRRARAPRRGTWTGSPFKCLAAALLLCLLPLPAFSVEPGEALPDPALEGRARMLSQELRCMVCQNQSIDDSAAPLARDLRILVRDRLKAGDSDGQVLDYLAARYGDFVLLKPRFASYTVLLWAAPFLVLFGGLGMFFWLTWKLGPNHEGRLTDEEERLLRRELDPDRDHDD